MLLTSYRCKLGCIKNVSDNNMASREHGFQYFSKVVGLPSEGFSLRHPNFKYVTVE